MNDNIAAFSKVLDPNDNSTGGGTASAVAGAMAAALVAMVARLSIGREGPEAASFYKTLASGSELVGPVPLEAIEEPFKHYLQVYEFSMSQIIENSILDMLG